MAHEGIESEGPDPDALAAVRRQHIPGGRRRAVQGRHSGSRAVPPGAGRMPLADRRRRRERLSLLRRGSGAWVSLLRAAHARRARQLGAPRGAGGRAMIGSTDLTGSPADKQAAAKKTSPGMASWGNEGPLGTTCRECLHWEKPEKDWQRYYSVSHDRRGALRPQKCLKACRMMNRSDLPKVEHHESSCKFFVPNPEPPPHSKPAG